MVLYSSHCPRCNMIEKLLKEKNISYTLIDDENEYRKVAEAHDIDMMPFAEIDGEIVDTKEIMQFINQK